MIALPDVFVEHEGIYLLSHSIGLPARGARDAAADYFEVWESDTSQAWPQWLGAIDGFREALSRLIGGQPASICPQSNVSSALSKMLGALRQSFDAPTILLTEDAFPSLGYVCEHAGYVVRYIAADLDATDPAVWKSALSADVDIVLITHVHSNTGEQIPVADIAGIARRQGVLSIVDVAQSVGVLPVDVGAWDVDVVVGSCVKWLSGGPGAGWLWVRPDLIERCTPVDVGWFSHDDPFEFDIHDFRYAGDALRFWGGTPTVLPFVIARHSIDAIRNLVSTSSGNTTWRWSISSPMHWAIESSVLFGRNGAVARASSGPARALSRCCRGRASPSTNAVVRSGHRPTFIRTRVTSRHSWPRCARCVDVPTRGQVASRSWVSGRRRM